MTIKIETSTMKGELRIVEDANIHDTMDVITGAMIAEGFSPASIIEGYERQVKLFNKETE